MQLANIARVIYSSLLIILIASVVSVYTSRPVAAGSSTSAIVLGVSDPLDPLIVDLQTLTPSVTILPSVASLGNVATNSILFIDGAWLQSTTAIDPTVLSLVIGKVVSGLPTIVVRGNPTLLGDSISGLTRWKAAGISSIADGISIANTLPDGTRVGATLQVIAGFDYAVGREFRWAQQNLLPTTTPGILAPLANVRISTMADPASPTWTFIIKATIDTGTAFAPYGRMTHTVSEYNLDNSGSTAYRWRNFFYNNTIEPGIQAFGSDWRTASELVDVQHNSSANLIVDHGPRDRNKAGPTTLTYNIGVQSGYYGAVVTASQSQSYLLNGNIRIDDQTQEFDPVWLHSIDHPGFAEGAQTFQMIPGWTDRITNPQSLDIIGSSATTFVEVNGGNGIMASSTSNFSFSASGG